MIKQVKAKKQYKCDLTNESIKVGEVYKRVNIRGLGIFHFKKECKNHKINSYIDDLLYEAIENMYYSHFVHTGENGIEW